jgi:hypothetical protein
MKLNDFSEENQEKIKKLAEKNNCTIDIILLIWEMVDEYLEERE